MLARYRAFLLLSTAVVAVDWIVWWLAAHYLTDTIYNPFVPPLAIIFLLALVYPLLIAVLDSRAAVLGCALSFGGTCANTLGSMAFGPAADYVPLPFVHGRWECNLADLCIAAGTLVMLVALALYAQTHYRLRLRLRLPRKRVSFRPHELSFYEWGGH
jgi:hypothetical protein